jgi:SAM-dependent methyltransferase
MRRSVKLRRPDPDADLAAQVAARYRGCGRFAFHYVAAKLRHDPLTSSLLTLGRARHFGQVVDLGCGRGQFACLLLVAGLADSVLGMDLNGRLLHNAVQATRGLEFIGRAQDFLHDAEVPSADTVLLVDVIYQLDATAQQKLLHAASRAARQCVVVRTADPQQGWRSTATRWLERGCQNIWPHAGAHVNAQPIGRARAILEANGYTIVTAPSWAGTPFSNVLLVAERAAASTLEHDRPNRNRPRA